jgi:hypothetical protein
MIATLSKGIEPFQKPTYRQQETSGHNPSSSDSVPEYLRLDPRVMLVTWSTVCAARGVNSDTVANMVDNALHPRHLRFVFNVSMGRTIRELRFWRTELIAPALVRNFTVQDAIARILGGRSSFRRSELEIAWQVSSNLLTDLIRANFLKGEHGRFLRSALEAFLFARWSGNNSN